MKGQNPFVLEQEGIVKYDQSLRAKLYAMGYTYNPAQSKVRLIGFTGWKNPNLCYNATVNFIKHRKQPNDVIVMLGSKHKQEPYHVILVDGVTGHVVFDNNEGTPLEGKYIPEDGYFATEGGRRLYDFVHAVTVKDFLKNTQRAVSMNSLAGNKVKETAAVDEQVLQDTLRALYYIMYYSTEDKPKITPALKKKADKWMASFTKFLNIFKIPKDDFITVMNAAKNNRKYTNAVDNALTVVGNMLAKAKEKFEKDNTIPKEELNQLLTFGRYFRTSNEKAALKLLSKASNIRDPDLLALLAVSGDEKTVSTKASGQRAILNKLKALSKQFLKKELVQLSEDERSKFKKTAPEGYKQFAKLQKQFIEVADNFLRKTVRASGQETIDYQDFLKKLKQAKISHIFPEGFVGKIDENGKYYTVAGLQLQDSPKLPITMNPKYVPSSDNTYPCTYMRKGSASPTKLYTLQWVQGTRAEKKFGKKLSVVKDSSDKLRNAWLTHLKTGTGRLPLHAARIELIWRFAARPGTKTNQATDRATGKKGVTYGISTMLVKHVKRVGNGIELDYPGKMHTGMKWIVKPNNAIDKRLIDIILSLTEGKGANDPLWFDEKKGKMIPTQDTLNYIKKLGDAHGVPGVTNYTLRYMAADGAARKALEKIKLKKGVSQKEAEAAFDAAMKEVGEVLKHHVGNEVTGNTARDNYVDPELMYKFFFKLGLRPKAKLPRVKPEVYKKWLKESQKSK